MQLNMILIKNNLILDAGKNSDNANVGVTINAS